MLRLDWNSEAKISKISKPVYVLSGSVDKLCPMVMGQELFNAAVNSKGKKICIVPGGDHNNTFMIAGEMYYSKL